MFLGKVELQKLVTKAFGYEDLTKKEARTMLKALWKKYWRQELDSFPERVVLVSYISFPDSKEDRDDYIKSALARLMTKADPNPTKS